jgi:hypothetical protein
MKKIFGLAIVSMAIFACNDAENPSINEDTRDTSTVIETPPAPSTTTAYVPADGDVTVKNDKVLVMRNGEWVETKEDVKLDNGVVVYRSGKAKKDGREIEVEDGVVINKEGDFFDRTGQAIENAWDDAKAGVKKAGDKIEDAVDDDDHHDDEKK